MNQVTTLKPCPICGGPARVVRVDSLVKITCGSPVEICRMEIATLWFMDFWDAAAAWNTRSKGQSQTLPAFHILQT